MKECSVIINENGMSVRYGDIRIQGLEDIQLKKSATDVGESLKEYFSPKVEEKETIEPSNDTEVINGDSKDSIESNDTSKIVNNI